MRVSILLTFICLTIIITWGCTKMECPPQTITLLVNDTSHVDTTHAKLVTDSIILLGAQIIHSEVHSINPNTNYATSSRLAVWALTDSNVTDTARSYLKFDYSAIPADVTITKATLTLYADIGQVEAGQKGYSVLSGPNNWYIIKLNSTWQASTITWNNAPVGDTTDALPIQGSGNSPFKTYIIDLTSIVNTEFTTPSSNYGIELRLATESKWRGLAFYSPEGPTALQPTLFVKYTK